MPKKTTRRPPPRRKAPPRRAPASAGTAVRENEASNGVVASAPVTQTVAQTVAPHTPAPTRRAGTIPRKTTGIAINYAYLSKDLKLLGVLAPSMIVLVVVAYFIFH